MGHTATEYARAFATVVKDVKKRQESKLVRAFVSLIEKNGDISKRDEIVRQTERMLARRHGKRHVLLETARPLENLRSEFKKFITSSDIVEEKVSPELVAGVRVTVDDEDQFDGSLKHKLDVLFS